LFSSSHFPTNNQSLICRNRNITKWSIRYNICLLFKKRIQKKLAVHISLAAESLFLLNHFEKDGCCCTIVDTQNKRPTLVCIVYLVIYEQFMFNQVQFLRIFFNSFQPKVLHNWTLNKNQNIWVLVHFGPLISLSHLSHLNTHMKYLKMKLMFPLDYICNLKWN
jgi:hypothetical protein